MADVKPVSERGVVEVVDVSRIFTSMGQDVTALSETSITAGAAEFVTILGPSGCGKSTLFHIVAGLLEPTSGEVFVHGEPVAGKRGHVAYMPQGDQLLPWRSIIDNVILGMEVDGVPRKRAREEAVELLRRFGLGDFVRSHPAELSGGMKQRAAFIRTMLFPRDTMLLDEPLGALDAQTRLLLQEWLLSVWSEHRKTILFITHDVDEAVFLSDRVYVMSARPGRVIDDVRIELPRPRGPELRASAEFNELKNQLLGRIRHETEKAFTQAARANSDAGVAL